MRISKIKGIDLLLLFRRLKQSAKRWHDKRDTNVMQFPKADIT